MHAKRTTIPADASLAALIEEHCADILASPGMAVEARCVQHGTTSVLSHSVAVTASALLVAQRLRMPVDARALARGALLHDYFLYDWHVPEPWHRLHGFTHPRTASRNAVRDHAATPHEQAIIRTHMFPLVPLPPSSREAWIVCLADKVVATAETAEGFRHRWTNHKELRHASQ